MFTARVYQWSEQPLAFAREGLQGASDHLSKLPTRPVHILAYNHPIPHHFLKSTGAVVDAQHACLHKSINPNASFEGRYVAAEAFRSLA